MFTVVIPMKVAQRESDSTRKGIMQPPKSMQNVDHNEKRDQKILLVEDNEMNQKIVVKVLKTKGLTCDVVCNGMEALKILEKNSYDLIFMDCQMPIMDGYECTRRIREREREGDKNRSRIIAMTANVAHGRLFAKKVDVWELYRKDFMECTDFDEQEALDFYEEFRCYLVKVMDDAKDCIREKQFEDLAKLCHQLKGSAGNLRIQVIQDLAILMEQAAKDRDIDGCVKYLKRMEEEM